MTIEELNKDTYARLVDKTGLRLEVLEQIAVRELSKIYDKATLYESERLMVRNICREKNEEGLSL